MEILHRDNQRRFRVQESLMAQELADELGEWFLDVNEEVSDRHAELKLVEMNPSGVKSFVAYLPAQVCRDLAKGLIDQADWLDRYGSE